MDGRPSGAPETRTNGTTAGGAGRLSRRALLVAPIVVLAAATDDGAYARRRSDRRRRRNGRGVGRSCHRGIRLWLTALAERAPAGDGVGGEATADESGGTIVHGDIGVNANVQLSASGGTSTEDASGGDGHLDIPPDLEATGEACEDRRKDRRQRRRQRRRRQRRR